MPLTPSPPKPSRANPSTFSSLADAWIAFFVDVFMTEFNAILPSIDAVVASTGAPMMIPPVGEYLLTGAGVASGAFTALAGAANRMEMYPFTPRVTFTADRLAINVTTGVAAALGKFAVYTSNALGQPDVLMVETATVDMSAAAVVEATVALTFSKGVTYWLVFRHSSTASLSSLSNSASPDINGGTTVVTTLRKSLRRTLAFGTAAPASWVFASSEINAGTPPAVWIRRS